MELFRLTRRKFADTLSGRGAAMKGARWNSTGVDLIYCATNRSLAMAEVAVHFTLSTLPTDYVMMTIFVPDDLAIQTVEISILPKGWNAFPNQASTQLLGDRLIASNQTCLIRVPSAVTKGDFNMLINPNHPDFRRITIVEISDFPFDKRIIKE
jgi:RES domain-containing protein